MKVHKNEILHIGNAQYRIIKKVGSTRFLVEKTQGGSIVKRRLGKRYLISLIRFEKKRKRIHAVEAGTRRQV